MSRKVKVLTHTRPAEAEGKAVRVQFAQGKTGAREYAWHANGVLTRGRAQSEIIERHIAAQLSRCGWATRTLKVQQHGQPPTFFVNIGYLRGLEPNALYEILTKLPHKCGHKKIIAAIQKLPEQVVRSAAPEVQPA